MLRLSGIRRAFDGVAVLRGVDLAMAQGEIVCLLGPSGCGKSTLLRIVAGLEQADSGEVLLDGQSIRDLPVHQRDFGLMFQDFALFPHLDVAGNVAFGLRMRGVSRAEQTAKIREALALVGLSGFEQRDVTPLSGGERQRVALARSLAPAPRLLMLDEPMGSLDAALRDRLVVELREIIKRVGLTALYVTHDQAEAYAIADRVAVMNAGRIEQIGAPRAIYERPATAFVARFLGLNNIVPVERIEAGQAQTASGTFSVSAPTETLLLHPDGLALVDRGTPDSIPARVVESTFHGARYRVVVEHSSGQRLTLDAPSRGRVAPLPGDSVAISVDPAAVIPLAGAP